MAVLSAFAAPYKGTVFIDSNGNGTFDKGEKTLKGVMVSDGRHVVKTQGDGTYELPGHERERFLFVTVPSGYKTTRHYHAIGQGRDSYDFALRPYNAHIGRGGAHHFVQISDTEISTATGQEEWVAAVRSYALNEKAAFIIHTGDICYEKGLKAHKPMFNTENMDVPVYYCIGNHDHDAGTSTDYLATNNYVTRLGPTDYAFNRGKAHIVVMDDVVCTTTSGSTWSYNAGFSEAQYNWLKADLDLVENKADKLVFLCCHIPFRAGSSSGGSNVNKDKFYDEVLNLLTQFKEAHIMIGHTHYPQNYIHTQKVCQGGKPIYEHVHGGACGAWWCSNLNTDGAPNGYSIYEVRGSSVYNWVAKSTNQPASYQMRVYDGNAVYSGQKGYSYTWTGGGKGGSNNINVNGLKTLEGCFVVSLWNDDPSNWKVELIQNGVSTPMKRISSGISDMCVVSFFFNELNKNTATWTRSLSHYWYAKSVSGKPSEDKNWTVRATQTIPSSGVTNVYESSALQTDFSGFAWN